MSINFAQKKKHRLHHFFIPCEANNHHPHFLHHRALHFYGASIIAVKIFVLAFFFIVYPNAAQFSTITSNRIVESTNAIRQKAGLPILMRNPALDKSALLKARDMIENNYFAHESPSGISPWEWFKAVNYNYTFAGENLAMNFSDAEEAMQAWMQSPTHRANILNANYAEIGVGVAVGKINGRQTTVVVQHFGKSFTNSPLRQFTRRSTEEELPKIAGTTSVSSGKAVEVTFRNSNSSADAKSLIAFYAKKFFTVLLIFIGINLILTIIIRIRVQHRKVILHTALVLLVGLLCLLLHPHFLESVAGGTVKIL